MPEANDFDPNCDPDNPRKITFDMIHAAHKRVSQYVIRTPCKKAHMGERLGLELYFKQECLQFTGCFKERGARNALLTLSDEQKKAGVCTASIGNHAMAMSYHAGVMGIACIVVMPVYTPIFKAAKCEELGSKVVLHGNNMAESKQFAINISREKKMIYVNGFDHPEIVAGNGTTGIELIEQVPGADAVLCQCGGGSLLAGVCVAVKHLKPDCEVYGVETDKTCSMVESLRKNERIFLDIDQTLADGLAVNKVGVNTFHTIKGLVDKMVVVKEEWIMRAVMHLIEEEKFVGCGAGSTAVAAVMAGLFPNLKGKKVVAIVSGGNIAMTVLSRVLERAMAAEGRLLKFKVTISDRPGGMAELCSLMAGLGVIMRDCVPERAWVRGSVFTVELKLLCETKGWDQTKDLIEAIKKNYKEYYFTDMGDHEKSASNRRGPCLAPNPVCMQR